MKEKLVTVLKYLLYALLAVLVLLCLFGFTFLMSWPRWVGIFLTLGVIGLCIGAIFFRRVLLRRKEQQFVQEVIDRDSERMKTLAAKELSQGKELQERWKEAVETLRRSHLRKQGNPLYVLPWYLMMGESGSGKSTALESARLASPFGGVQKTSGVSGTRNCDWWFFDQSIIIDTAGRYALPADSARDNEEWQKFLSLLVKYRKKEPIHGLIMTVAADKLASASAETLEADGKELRRRLDELMRVLGVSFPVYLLVTKCDLIRGMTQFTSRLSEQALNQPMGVVNQELSKEPASFLPGALGTLAERLKDLRIRLLQQESGPLPAEALLFPDEFLGLGHGLQTFTRAAFEENRYQETPVLRGIYFSSGRQEGTPFAHFLNKIGMITDQEVLPGTTRGLFLHDFFDKVLPRDRALLAPTSRAAQWQILTRNIGLTSWVLLWIALSGLMSYSFVKNMATIRTASALIARAPQLTGDFLSDVATMDQYRRMILSVEQQNRHWWVPRFGLKQSLDAEQRLKAQYCKQFQERFLASFDRSMSDAVSGFSGATPDELAGQYLVHITRRINLLKLRVAQGTPEALAAKPRPSYVLASQPRPDELERSRKFGEQYLNYLFWRGDSAGMKSEIGILQSLLKHIVTVKGSNLRWLPEWVNRQGIVPALTLQSFWGGSRSASEEASIPPAYTRKGRELVLSFQNELRQAYPEPEVLEREQGAFESWYRGNCYAAWLCFAAAFPKGAERLNGAKEWRAVAALMPTEQGPYFAFFDRAASELASFGELEGMPPLLQQIIQFRLLKDSGAAAGAAGKAVEEGKKLTAKVGDLLGTPVPGAVTAVSQAAAAKAATDYRTALASIAPAAKSRPSAYQMAVQVFSEDPAVSKSPFYLAYEATQRLKGEIRGDENFGRLANGPLSFLWSYVQKEAACAIQTQWEEQVLREAQGGTDPQMLQYLVAQEGPVWKFVNGSLGSFQGWSPARGYYAKAALGGSVQFQPSFFTFLAKGTKAKVALARPAAPKQTSYPVTIKGLPTDANAEARTKPQSTRLELQCASGPQTMENLNYPVTKTFTWSGDSCGEVSFQIEVGELVLTRQYSGFPAFLKDFQGGRHTFYPQDFPKEKGALERLGIRFIRPNYQFTGAMDVVAQGGGAGNGAGGQSLGGLPRSITKCWD